MSDYSAYGEGEVDERFVLKHGSTIILDPNSQFSELYSTNDEADESISRISETTAAIRALSSLSSADCIDVSGIF